MGFLAGNPRIDRLNKAINEVIYSKGTFFGRTPILLLTCDPQEWDGQLEVICNPQQQQMANRRHYVFQEFNYKWQHCIPQDIQIQRMNKNLLDEAVLTVPYDVKTIIEKWDTMDKGSLKGDRRQIERLRDFGFELSMSKQTQSRLCPGQQSILSLGELLMQGYSP